MPTDYAPPTYDEIRTALSYIPTPSSYADWYPMAYAIKDALGENGKDLWHDWSRQGDNYKASVAEATWKSAKSKAGGITVATLFKQARDNGYRPEKPYVAPNPEQRARIARERATQDEIWAVYNHVRHQSATRLAHTIWRNAKALTAADLAHPYLQSKGIQDVTAVAGIRINRYKGQNKLVIPIYSRNGQTGKTELVNLQQIEESGEKRFLAGGQKSGGYAILNGTHADMAQGFYLAEGYATAASVHLATGKPVVIAFDAGNLPVVAARIIGRGNLPADTPIYLAADNDRASQKGLTKAAEAAAILGGRAQIRLPEFDARDITVWQQRHGQLDADGKEQFPSDFNDLAEIHGMDAVKEALGTPLSAERTAQVAAMQPEIAHQIAHIQNKAPESPQESPETLPPDEAGLRFRAEYVLEKFGGERNEKYRNALITELAQRGVDIRGAVNGILEERKAAPQPQPETAKPSPTSENTPFTQAVDNVVTGKVPAGYIQLGTTPDVLQMLGVPQGKVRIAGGTIEKAVADYLNRQNAYDKNRHAVNPDDLKLLPGEMNDPIAVFKSATQSNSLVVLTRLHERENDKEKPVIAAVHLSKGKGKHGADLIDVVSVYGRSDTQLERAFQDDLLYANKKKVQEFLTTHPLQLHWDITSETELSYRHIKTESDLAQWQNAHRQPENPLPSQNLTQPKKEAQMAQSPTPEDIQRHAQNVAQIADAAEREAMMSEMAEQGIYVRGAVNKILAERAAEIPQQPENEHGEFPQSQSGQPENAASPTFADELSALNLPADFSFEYQVLPNGREIARIHLADYGGELMVDKIEADKGGGYVAVSENILGGKPIHLDNLSTLMREMTFQMRQAAERSQHQESTAVQPQKQPETAQPPQPTAADNAAVAVSEPFGSESQSLKSGWWDNQPDNVDVFLVGKSRQRDYVKITHNEDGSFNGQVAIAGVGGEIESATRQQLDNWIQVRTATMGGGQEKLTLVRQGKNGYTAQLEHPPEPPQPTAADNVAVAVSEPSETQTVEQPENIQGEPLQNSNQQETNMNPSEAQAVENSIEFGGITQEQAQSPTQSTESQPQLETISAAEVQENLRRAKEKERIEAAQQFTQEAAVGAAIGIAADAALDVAMPSSSMAKTAVSVAAGFAGDAAAERVLQQNPMQKPERDAENTEKQPEISKPQPILDHHYSVPSNIQSRYIQTNSGLLGHLNYSDINSHNTVVFQDKGNKLSTPKNDAQTISDMLDVAQAKNWGSIKISGSAEFKRQMWLEANLRGIATSGYKPSKEDLALLANQRENRSRNSIEHQPLAPEPNKPAQEAPSKELGARLVAHGKDHYNHNPDKGMSYFVLLEKDGKQWERWGMDLERAMKESGAQVGDKVELTDKGKDGKRNSFEIQIIERTASPDFTPLRSEADKQVTQAQTTEQKLHATQIQEQVTAGAAKAEQPGAEQRTASETVSPDKTNGLMNDYHKKLNRLSKDDMAMMRKVEVAYLQILEKMPHKTPDEREFMRRSVYQTLSNMIQGNRINLPRLEPSQQQQAQQQTFADKGKQKGKDNGMSMSD